MINLRPILFVNGMLLCIIAGVMCLPIVVDLFSGDDDFEVFAVAAFTTGFIGGMLCITNRGKHKKLSIRDTFLLTTSSYISMTLAASLPLYLSALDMSYVDAFFEASSGITATGSTVLTGLDTMPPGILLWRSLINGLGGLGVVVLAMAVLPMLNIGGMQLFKSESSDTTEKMLPRATQIAGVITGVFCVLVFMCMVGYWMAGMTPFDALNHAITTVATAGFSTHDASIGHYDSVWIEMVAMVFMLSGALPFILYYQSLRPDAPKFWQNSQVQFFFIMVGVTVAVMAGWLILGQDYAPFDALRYASFNVISIITTTGYASADYAEWGGFATTVFFIAIVFGGCTGSTTGGIKTFRFQVLYETARTHLLGLMQPSGVFLPNYDGKKIPPEVVQSVMSFFLVFAFCFSMLAVALSAFDLDFITAMSAAAQAISNVGPGLGPIIGPSGNYGSIADGAKWLLAFTMIFGRLELFTVLVLLSPHFWRD